MEIVDKIHGRICIPIDIYKIIQTQQVQRLENIKQLGLNHLTLPEAKGTRLEHLIGTFYLAGKMLDALEKNTNGLRIPDFYRKCVMIAALLHDVGHGPFSHTWEVICDRSFTHEENAKPLIESIFQDCELKWEKASPNDNDKFDKPYAIELINALIVGGKQCLRDPNYGFIFDIVNNKKCGIDVDKWDYLERDTYYAEAAGLEIPGAKLEFGDVFLQARASPYRNHIQYRNCDFQKMYDLFYKRYMFHKKLYQRPITICLEQILYYIISECSDRLEINGIKLKEIGSDNLDTFLQLDDNKVWDILNRIQEPLHIVKLIKCLQSQTVNRTIVQLDSKEEEIQNSRENYLKVEINIKHPGEEFKSNEVEFYGPPPKKPVVQKKGNYIEKFFFKINE